MYGVSETIKSTILELPYANQEFSMILILPEPQLGIDSLVKQIKVEHLEEIFMNLYDDEVEVQIPKFKFEQEFGKSIDGFSIIIEKINNFFFEFQFRIGRSSLFNGYQKSI